MCYARPGVDWCKLGPGSRRSNALVNIGARNADLN